MERQKYKDFVKVAVLENHWVGLFSSTDKNGMGTHTWISQQGVVFTIVVSKDEIPLIIDAYNVSNGICVSRSVL